MHLSSGTSRNRTAQQLGAPQRSLRPPSNYEKTQELDFFFLSENLNALTVLHATALEESNGMKIRAREAGAHLGHLNKSMFNNLYSRGSQNR